MRQWVLAFSLLLTTQTCLAEELVIPKDTRVPFVFKTSGSTVQIRKGDKVLVEVVEDVTINNRVVFRKGDQGSAVIKSRSRPSVMGLPGTIDVGQAFFTDTFGNKHEMRTKYQAVGSQTHLPGAMLGSTLVFPILAPITAFMFFKKGKDVSIPEGVIVDGFTLADLTVPIADSGTPSASVESEVPKTDELKDLIEKLGE